MGKKMTCFFCPTGDYQEHELSDRCPTCGRPLGFPETSPPDRVGNFKVVRALPRGFYSATYLVEQGNLRRRYVLKVVPKKMYEFFKKDFPHECAVHEEVARDSDHVVDIIDYSDGDVTYDGVDLSCWIAQLEYVEGRSLREFLASSERPTARAIAQISIDLLSLLAELEAKQVFHNDLHADNIIVSELTGDARRTDQIDERLRAVAIDLGSITDQSRTGNAGRLGDLHDVARHLLQMADILLRDPSLTTDADYRLAATLSDVAHSFAPPSEHQRVDYRQAIDDIRDSFVHQRSPWDVPARLRRLDEGYNAAALHPWFVPRLLVDPKGKWLERISQAGPLVITGMRGCGKTMLLRAMEFHARLSNHKQDNRDPADVIAELQKDGYVGLYVSCNRLLDIVAGAEDSLHEPYARLFLAYAREALRGLRHLREVSKDAVVPGYHQVIAAAIRNVIAAADLGTESDGETVLEGRVIDMLSSLQRREGKYSTSMHPTSAFTLLADAVRACTPPLPSAQVFFLLDDVSTRHLNPEGIADLLSGLLFADPGCAFKMTSETQTLELVLRSPGLIEKARERRDYSQFDLGAEVNRELNASVAAGKRFISQILQQRIALTADQFTGLTPEQRLGDITLEDIARRIVDATRESGDRKHVYYGISALSAVCVGDIGDVITLYEMMVTRAGSSARVTPELQSKCFQELCSRRLYNVNRRNGKLKDFALTFAAAAHDLMVRSARKAESRGLRQYYSIYARITSGDVQKQISQIRELTDSGVFVLDAGADAPRSKTRDSDPIQQVILTYRKLFGLSSYIGLGDRDRFELSGSQLEEWLDHPERGEEILMRSLTGPREEVDGNQKQHRPVKRAKRAKPDDGGQGPAADQIPVQQLTLDSIESDSKASVTASDSAHAAAFMDRHGPSYRDLEWTDLSLKSVDCLVLGLGFEERTETSLERILQHYHPRRAVAVKYDEPGRGESMRGMLRSARVPFHEVPYDTAALESHLRQGELTLVDVTGLAKPVLFTAVSTALKGTGRLLVVHTMATKHYPTDEDIHSVFEAEEANDAYRLMESLDKLLTGEKPPYSFVSLLSSEGDDSLIRVLAASASPKHERLLSLLDDRDFDILEILHPSPSTPRGRLATFAAELALRERSGRLHVVESDDLGEALRVIGSSYYSWYILRGTAFEMALTGSKMHAVAMAAAASAFKVNQCWYVRPAAFDPDRFTSGVGASQLVELSLPKLVTSDRALATV